MSTIDKPTRRPWQPKQQAHEGRLQKTDFYHSTAWRKTRSAFLKAHPLCVECTKINITKAADMVDHKNPINRENPYDTKGGIYGDPLNWDNLQNLCNHHHAVKSGKESKLNR